MGKLDKNGFKTEHGYFGGVPISSCNSTLSIGKDFYISFSTNSMDYGDITTALVIGQHMETVYILNGDHRQQYANIINNGLNTCIDYFKNNQKLINKYSDKIGEMTAYEKIKQDLINQGYLKKDYKEEI